MVYAVAPLVAVIVTILGVLVYRRLTGSGLSPLIVGGIVGFLTTFLGSRLERRRARPTDPQRDALD